MTVNELIAKLSALSPEERELPVTSGYDKHENVCDIDDIKVWPERVDLY